VLVAIVPREAILHHLLNEETYNPSNFGSLLLSKPALAPNAILPTSSPALSSPTNPLQATAAFFHCASPSAAQRTSTYAVFALTMVSAPATAQMVS
jgi:hypothetical protein